MPKRGKWIKYDVTMIEDNHDCWVFLTWFMSLAKRYDYGVVPHSVVDSSAFMDLSGLDMESAKSQFRSALKRSLVFYCSISAPISGRGYGKRTVTGWRYFAWDEIMMDPRVVKRSVEKHGLPTFRYYVKGESPITLVDVVEKCISCMPLGGRSTRVLSLDAMSMDIIQNLINEHGASKVHDALDKCGGAGRPAYMLKKIMSDKGGAARSSVPTREEWLKG